MVIRTRPAKKKQNMSKSICYFSYRCVSYTIFVIIFFFFFHSHSFFREFLALGQTIFFYQMNSRRSKKEKNWNKNIIRHSLYIFFCFRFSAIQTIFRMAENQKNTENKEARDWFMALCEYIEVYIFLGIYSYIYIYLRLKRCNYFLYYIIIFIKKLLDEMKNKCPFV